MLVDDVYRQYPRRYCLGLIEAARSRWPSPRRRPGIRGVIASASLKLETEQQTDGESFEYPRRYCLGLIEAAAAVGSAAVGSACIRGVIASASLKHSRLLAMCG